MARTMFEKIWARHVVAEGPGGQTLLYVDRHLLHEGSTAAFVRLARSGRRVRRPDLSFATADHYVLTSPGAPAPDAEIGSMVASLTAHTAQQGIVFFALLVVLPAQPEVTRLELSPVVHLDKLQALSSQPGGATHQCHQGDAPPVERPA